MQHNFNAHPAASLRSKVTVQMNFPRGGGLVIHNFNAHPAASLRSKVTVQMNFPRGGGLAIHNFNAHPAASLRSKVTVQTNFPKGGGVGYSTFSRGQQSWKESFSRGVLSVPNFPGGEGVNCNFQRVNYSFHSSMDINWNSPL